MASKVNVKFVAILAGSLIGVFVLAVGGLFFLMRNSPSDLERMGDKAMAKGDYNDASLYYSKAVDRDHTSVQYLTKWRDSLAAKTPDTPLKFNDALSELGRDIPLARGVQRDNIQAQKEYLDIRKQQILSGAFDREQTTYLLNEAQTLIAYHASQPSGPWEILRKYRGMANLRLFAQSPDPKPSDWDTVKADLEAALKADPTDTDSVMTLEAYYNILAERAEKQDRREDSQKYIDAANTALHDFLDHNPNDALVALAILRRDMQLAVRTYQIEREAAERRGEKAPDPISVSHEFMTTTRPKLDAVAAMAEKLPPEKQNETLMSALRQVEQAVDPAAKLSRTEALLAAALAKRPQDASLLFFQADLASDLNDFPRAIAAVQKIIDLPPAHVGIEGSRVFSLRAAARYVQVIWSVRAYLASPEADRPAALTRVREYRQKLAAAEAADSPRLLMADAWVAYADQQWDRADKLMEQVQRATRGVDGDSMVLWANISMQRQQPGKARERLLSVLQMQPQNVAAAVALAQLEVNLQNYDNAIHLYDDLLKLYPTNKDYQDARNRLLTLKGERPADDPVAAVLLQADKMRGDLKNDPQQFEKVGDFLDKKIATMKPDFRLYAALIQTRAVAGDRTKALETLQRAQTALPDSAELKSIAVQLSDKSELDKQLALIDLANASPFEKSLARHQAYRGAGINDKAREEIAKMAALEPENKKLIEIKFLDALERGDMAEAEKQSDLATKQNVDNADGKTFQSRVLAAKGDFVGAATMMQDVVRAGAAQPETWRLLGRFQMGAGRPGDAAAADREALALRPSDPGATVDLMVALVALKQQDQALAIARNSLKYPAIHNSIEFTEMWLNLEQEIGDHNIALDTRERMALVDPKNRQNLGDLAMIYLKNGDFTKARQTIDKVRALKDDIDGVELDALWNWGQNDIAKAKSIYTDYIATLNGVDKLHAQLRFAQFLVTRGDITGAVAALESARTLQDPKNLEADKALADMLFATGRIDTAIDALHRILTAGADTPNSAYRKRLIEALMRQGKFDEADKELTTMIGGKDPDVIATLLQSDIRVGAKDRKGARAILDRAVARFPNESVVFVKRGQFLMQDEATLRDAIADFTKAIQLTPNAWQTYRLRAGAYGSLKGTPEEQQRHVEEALADMRQAVKLNPGDESLLVGVVSDLLLLGRDADAEAVANDSLSARSRDANVLGRMGKLFQSGGRNAIAAKYFDQAFALDASDAIAQSLLDCLLSDDGLDVVHAQKVLDTLGKRVDGNPGFMMAQAKVRLRQGRPQDAGRAAIEALRMLDPTNAAFMLAWDNDMRRLLPEKDKYRDFLEQTIKRGVLAKANEWLAYFKSMNAGDNPQYLDETLRTLEGLATQGENPQLRLFARRAHGELLYQVKRIDEAVASMRVGLAAYPDDLEINNNLAFILAMELKKPADALPLLPALAKAAGNNADALDTVGLVYHLNGKDQEALEPLEKASATAQTTRTAVSAWTHLADVRLALGKKAEAADAVARVDALLAADKKFDIANAGSLKTELEQIKARIGKP